VNRLWLEGPKRNWLTVKWPRGKQGGGCGMGACGERLYAAVPRHLQGTRI